MTKEFQLYIAEKIYDTLNRQRFNDWYTTGAFDAHIQGDKNCKDKEAILSDIIRLFELNIIRVP